MNTGFDKMDRRSRERLAGVHPTLGGTIEAFAKTKAVIFIVTEGIRTKERQRELVNAGASRTMNSKHLVGRAVDLAVVVGDEVRWDWPLYRNLANHLCAFASGAGVKIIAGANWKTFPDGPHFELADSVK